MFIHTPNYSDVPTLKKLELSEAPKGKISRYWVHIVSDGMGQPVFVPVIVAKGNEAGPIMGVTAVVHGNELNGLPVVQKIFQTIEVEKLRGTLVGIPVVNVPGFLQNQRFFSDGQDLNRIMPGRVDGNNGEVYGYRIINKIIHQVEYLIDLHTASFGRINSYYIRADLQDPITAKMAELQNAEIIVNNPAPDSTLRGSAGLLGIHAITVEAGDPHKFQRGMIRSAITGTFNVMRYLDMIDEPIVTPDEAPVICRDSYWIYTSAGGILEVFPQITEKIVKDQKIARVRNIFGDVIKEYYAPEDGVVIGKSINPINPTGSRILHLGFQ